MADFFKCCPCGPSAWSVTRPSPSSTAVPSFVEKEPLIMPRPRDVSHQVREIAHVLRTTEESGPALARELDDIVHRESWTEWLAEEVLHAVEHALASVDWEKWGTTLREARERAEKTGAEVYDELFREMKEHRTEIIVGVVVAVVAVGVLVVMAPWVLEVLGFGVEGPIEGTYAALWQSRYLGYVPKNSIFSYMQRMGMVWGRA